MKRKNKVALFLLFFLGIIFFCGGWALAGIKVSPAMIVRDVMEEDYIFFTTITNTNNYSIKVSVYFTGMSHNVIGGVNSKEGKEDLLQASKIFKVEPVEFILAPEEEQEVKIVVDISQGQKIEPSGAAYAELMFESRAVENQGGTISSVACIGVPILISLPGLKEKLGKITGFNITQDKINKEIKFYLRFKNTGNVHFSPQGGKIVIKDERGLEKGKISVKPHMCIPGCERDMDASWAPEVLPIGEYSAKGILEIEEGKIIESGEITFSVVEPYKLAQPKCEISNFPEIKVVQKKPVNFSFLLTNAGNVKLNPKINLEIRDLENNIITTIPIVGKELNVGSSEEFKGVWEKGLPAGDYQAIVNVEYSKQEFGGIKKAVATAKITVIEKELVLKGEISSFTVDSIKSGEAVVPQLFFKNTGNTEFAVEGLIELKNSAGKTVGQIPVNKVKLAEKEEKRVGGNWSGTLPVGLYKAVATLIYGEGKMVSGEASFLVK